MKDVYNDKTLFIIYIQVFLIIIYTCNISTLHFLSRKSMIRYSRRFSSENFDDLDDDDDDDMMI